MLLTNRCLNDHGKIIRKKLQKKESNIAAILSANKPLLKADFNIVFTLPNQLMEEQLNQGKPQLMKYLHESLNNYGISIETIVNETMEKRFAYTPLEKYKRLKEKNPMIEKLLGRISVEYLKLDSNCFR